MSTTDDYGDLIEHANANTTTTTSRTRAAGPSLRRRYRPVKTTDGALKRAEFIAQAWEYRKAGKTLTEIAAITGRAPSTVREAILDGLACAMNPDTADQVRALETERIETLQSKLWQRITEDPQDDRAYVVWLQYETLKLRMHGLLRPDIIAEVNVFQQMPTVSDQRLMEAVADLEARKAAAVEVREIAP